MGFVYLFRNFFFPLVFLEFYDPRAAKRETIPYARMVTRRLTQLAISSSFWFLVLYILSSG